MRTIVRAALVAAVLGAAPCASAQDQNDFALTRAQMLYRQMQDSGQCEAALPEARAFASSGDFAVLSSESQINFLYEVIGCAYTLRDGHAGIEAANRARALGADWADAMRVALGVDFQDDALAVNAFSDLVAHSPDRLRQMEGYTISRVLRAAHRFDATEATTLHFYDLLEANGYAPPDGSPNDGLRVEHARLLIRSGHVDHARRRLASVIDPEVIEEIRIDKLFDPLRQDAAFERRLSPLAAAEADLARARQTVTGNPRKLSAVLQLAQALRVLGRSEEAIAALDPAIAAAQSDNPPFDDVDEQLNWLLNEKAYALYDLGRASEAHNAFVASMALHEDGGWNVSQVINFASMLNDEGRGADALEVVRTVGEASPYGDMWAAAVRACGAEIAHNATVRDEAMRFLREHETDNVSALSQGLLCVNDLDGAAALFVRRLANPDQRASALIALQRYRTHENTALPHKALLLQRLAIVRERSDVRVAVEAVGRIEDVPLFSTYWGDV